MRLAPRLLALFLPLLCVSIGWSADAKKKPAAAKAKAAETPWVTPELPGGKTVVTDTSELFLKTPAGVLREGVAVAKAAPTIDFLYVPGQTYKASIWSNWGDSLAANGKYYCAIGDHIAPGGNAFVYEYDPNSKSIRTLVDLRKLLNLPDGWYTPGKIHSRIDLGRDGWLYFSTHRGSTRTTTAEFHYTGDWIVRADPRTEKVEVVAHGPVKNHCMPASVLDPERLIYYAGTAPGTKEDGDIHFLAYDVQNKKIIYAGPAGPARLMIFARSTGKIYYVPNLETGELVCFDPANPSVPTPIKARIAGLRAATEETSGGMVYCIGGTRGDGITLFSFNTKTEAVEELGPAAVAPRDYIASADVDPTGRYVYYVPGAHGGAQNDGSPIVQFDVKTRQRKVIAFLSPFYKEKYGVDPVGTYATAIDPQGDKLYITWNATRGVAKAWDCCAITVVHIPQSERQP